MDATPQRAGPSNTHRGAHNTVCSFCNEAFDVRNLPTKRTKCGHRLHTHCMNRWLPRTKKCPVCQTAIVCWIDLNNRCAMCYSIFKGHDLRTTTECKHEFHNDCLSRLLQVTRRCPICRRNIQNIQIAIDVFQEQQRLIQLFPYEECMFSQREQMFSLQQIFSRQLQLQMAEDNDDVEEEEVEEKHLEREDTLGEEDEGDSAEDEELGYEAEEDSVEEEEYSREEDNIDDMCTICQQRFEESENPAKRTECGHWLHIHCMNNYLPQAKKCPVCQYPIKWTDVSNKCVICLDMFHASDESQRLPCSHRCHSECLDQLMVTRDRCPVCRRQIIIVHRKCVICLEDIAFDAAVRRLPCEHEFHDACVTPWLQDKSTCPLCILNVH